MCQSERSNLKEGMMANIEQEPESLSDVVARSDIPLESFEGSPSPSRPQTIKKGMIIGRCWRDGCWKALFWPWHRCKKGTVEADPDSEIPGVADTAATPPPKDPDAPHESWRHGETEGELMKEAP
jgi:hypothetical protein